MRRCSATIRKHSRVRVGPSARRQSVCMCWCVCVCMCMCVCNERLRRAVRLRAYVHVRVCPFVLTVRLRANLPPRAHRRVPGGAVAGTLMAGVTLVAAVAMVAAARWMVTVAAVAMVAVTVAEVVAGAYRLAARRTRTLCSTGWPLRWRSARLALGISSISAFISALNIFCSFLCFCSSTFSPCLPVPPSTSIRFSLCPFRSPALSCFSSLSLPPPSRAELARLDLPASSSSVIRTRHARHLSRSQARYTCRSWRPHHHHHHHHHRTHAPTRNHRHVTMMMPGAVQSIYSWRQADPRNVVRACGRVCAWVCSCVPV